MKAVFNLKFGFVYSIKKAKLIIIYLTFIAAPNKGNQQLISASGKTNF